MNGYFQLVTTAQGTGVRVFPPQGDGTPVTIDMVKEYLNARKFEFDILAVKEAVTAANGQVTVIMKNKALPERESYKLDISDDQMTATILYYPPTEGGTQITAQDVIKDLAFKKIRNGVLQDQILAFFNQREYCREYVIAQGTPAVQGKDAVVEYRFGTSHHAHPTMNPDGTVDYFHLNLINNCKAGDVLAVLSPADMGKPGITVFGTPVKPRQVKVMSLHYGKNVVISEDKLTLTAAVDGHVTLQEGKVVVSNVIQVANVDVSTGNIEYDGSVEVEGNVASNFAIKAGGNVHVKGNVEGAVIEAGADVILERGVNGMGRAEIKAGGNVVTKFIENAKVTAGGSVNAESLIHAHIIAGTEVTVTGKKGFITGGHVIAAERVSARTLGSDMGANTVIEVGADPQLKIRMKNLQKTIGDDKKKMETIRPTLDGITAKLRAGVKFNPEQVKYTQQLLALKGQLELEMQECAQEYTELQDKLAETKEADVVVEENAYPGTTVVIGDLSMNVKKIVKYSRFVLKDGDVRVAPI